MIRITLARLLTAAAVVLACTAVLTAQATLTGTWQGESRSGIQIVLELTTTKTAFTGTLTFGGERSAISDASLSKNAFTFKATAEGQLEGFSGELIGDQIKFWPDRLGPERALMLKRVTK